MVSDGRTEERIREVLLSYFHGIDRRDFGQVADCFTDDATARYGGSDLPTGSAAITAELRRRMERLGVTMHVAGNLLARAEGDAATAETYVVAYVSEAGSSGAARMRVRGLRYRDRLVRTETGWKIADRVHSLDWSYEVDAQVFPE